MIDSTAYVHPLANVETGAAIGANTRVWQFATVRAGAKVGADCIIGQGAFVDADVVIGDRCKLENYVSVHRGARVDDEVFLGPGAILANDRWPRATTASGALKTNDDWRCEPAIIEKRASIGAGAIVLPGVRVGRNAMVGAGAVVTRDVGPNGVVVGSPARAVGVAEDALVELELGGAPPAP
jgi:acetyltransferase-like isoleucine patch superfamily enzyme